MPDIRTFTVWGTSFAKIGDEAQLVAIDTILRRLWPGADVAVLDKPRALTDGFYPKIKRVRLSNIVRSLPRLWRSDLLVVVGAPFFEAPRQVCACLVLFALARLARVSVVAYGVTVFDLKTRWGTAIFRRLFATMPFIAVREPGGVNVLARHGFHDTVTLIDDTRAVLEPADQRAVLAKLRHAGIDPDRPIIGVTSRYLHEDVPEWVKRDHGITPKRVRQANDALGRMVAQLSEHNEILLIPMHPTFAEDEAMADLFRAYVRNPEVVRILQPGFSARECIGIIALCRCILSGRLASTVFALNTATPVAAIAYESRVQELMEAEGCGDCVFPWTALTADALTPFIAALAQGRHKARFLEIAKRRRSRAWQDTKQLMMHLG